MFDLEKSISEWRKEMLAAGIKTPVPFEELEAHLREEIGAQVAAGTPPEEAFRLAASRVGKPGLVACEFKKSGVQPVPVAVARFVWLMFASVGAAFMICRWFFGKGSVLLDTHGFTLTVGYLAALLAGGLGIYHVCRRLTRMLGTEQQESLRQAMYWFSGLAAVFVFGGLLLGMIWSRFCRGNYLPGDPRAIGTFCASIWLLASYLIQRSARVSGHVTAALCIGGNMIVSLAWFGAGILALGFNVFSYWPLHAFLGIHLLFLALVILPTSKVAKA